MVASQASDQTKQQSISKKVANVAKEAVDAMQDILPKKTGKLEITQAILEPELTSTPSNKEVSAIDSRTYGLSVRVLDAQKPVEGAKVILHSTPREAITDKQGGSTF